MLRTKKNLVFQGGSVKGIAYLGALSALRETNYVDFDSIERVAGTSAGAMTALAMALNYSMEELTQVLSVDVQTFLDDANSRVSKKTLLNLKDAVLSNPAQPNRLPFVAPAILMDLRENLGLFPGKEVRDWLDKLITEKTGIQNTTFEELHSLRAKKPELHFKDLYVVGFNVNTKGVKTFSWDKTPSAIIADSVRISMGIPFVFSPYQYFVKDESGNPVLAEGYEKDLWIDGGIAENYPIKIFDGTEVNMETLGFYLACPEELNMIQGMENPSSPHRIEIDGMLDYARAVLDSALFINQQLIQHIRGLDRCRTIYIDTMEIGTLDFNISIEQKNSLIQSGWDAALKFAKDSQKSNDRQTDEQLQKSKTSGTETCPIQIKPITLDNVKCVLLDLSGTLHIGDTPTEGAVAGLERLRRAGLSIRFVTNTTKESKRSLMERLSRMGFAVESNEMFTSLVAARQYVEKKALNPFFIIDKNAEEDFEGILNSEKPNAVLIGLAKTELNYANLNRAFSLLLSGAELIAIHKGRYYRDGDELSLGPGPFVRALEFASSKEAIVIGKPEPEFFSSAVESTGCKIDEAVMIGDDVQDDVCGAIKLGIKGILVKTGKYRENDEKNISPPPHHISESFAAAVDIILDSIQGQGNKLC